MGDAETPTTFDPIIKAIARVDSGALAPGQILDGHYELLERVGGGGMGIVYKARDHRVGRDVAVKALRPTGGATDEHMRRLFEREARATAQLLHPNVVTLHHVGEHGGHPYLVLELLSGETLAARIARRGKLPLAEALAVLDAVLAALVFAHEHGVLHRDLKPTNVFVTGDERVKVLDFGVALSLDAVHGPVTRAAGTPGYMAPEQADGADQDPRTDVWAAAMLLLECLTGRHPEERNPMAALDHLDPSSPVRPLLSRALAGNPDTRPASAAVLRRELAAIAAPPPPRRRSPLRIAAVVLASALAGGGAMFVAARGGHETSAVTAAEINGHAWHVNFGELQIHVDASGAAYGVYDQGSGIQLGTFADGYWRGWWCQEPSRKAPEDAGPFELHFVRGNDRILIEGKYKYGDGRAASWQSDFYGVSLETRPSYKLEQRLQRHELCPGH